MSRKSHIPISQCITITSFYTFLLCGACVRRKHATINFKHWRMYEITNYRAIANGKYFFLR